MTSCWEPLESWQGPLGVPGSQFGNPAGPDQLTDPYGSTMAQLMKPSEKRTFYWINEGQ